jgi:hypothetical protein
LGSSPKNKLYCGSLSPKTRVAVAVSIVSLGFEAFFLRLFARLGIELMPGTKYWLETHERAREKKAAKQKQPEVKQKRRECCLLRLLERQKSQGTRGDEKGSWLLCWYHQENVRDVVGITS